MFVIDTVAIRCCWPLHRLSHEDWRFTWQKKDLDFDERDEYDAALRTIFGYHRIFGIYIHGSGSRITSMKASLPRLIHGDNAELIQNQQEVEQALQTLRDIVGEIADTSSAWHHFTRVDLCWQFQHDPAALIRAHRHCVYPRCQVSKREFGDRSAAWEYTDKRITIYDKVLERTGRPGDIVRVEVQLRKESLKRFLGEEGVVGSLDFSRCYQVFRRILTTFAPSVTVQIPRDLYEALAIIDREAGEAGRASPLSLFLSALNSRTGREWRRRITAAQLRREHFQWERVLAESGPPTPVSATRSF